MDVLENVSLASYSTMGLGGPAAYLTEVTGAAEVAAALAWAAARQLPAIMIGGGSNIIWRDAGFPGLVLVDKILSYEVRDDTDGSVLLTIGSGEPWDSVVERSVAAGLTGIEALSLIPGSAGATPVQNVGAYGQEIAQTLVSLEAYDTQADARAGAFVTLAAADCGFSYRSSRFKTTDRGRFYITSLTLRLRRGRPQPPFYGAVQKYFEEHAIDSTAVTPASLREAVIAIRRAKLPDPATIHNTGSFFANPIVSAAELAALLVDFPDLPHWPATSSPAAGSAPSSDSSDTKLSAAWLIDQAGFHDHADPETGMATWPKQSLVLINQTARTTADLLQFKQKIVAAVQAKFQITLQQEPELLP